VTFVSTDYGPEQLSLVVDETAPVRAETMAISGWSIVDETREGGVLRTEGRAQPGSRSNTPGSTIAFTLDGSSDITFFE